MQVPKQIFQQEDGKRDLQGGPYRLVVEQALPSHQLEVLCNRLNRINNYK